MLKLNPLKMLIFYLQFLVILRITDGAIFTPEFENNLHSFVNASMECRRIPGMTLTVVKGNEVWSSGFGTSDYSTGRRVDEHSLFNIGSVTKSFTATLLAMLLQEHKLSWSTKASDILGQEYEFVDEYRTQELTVKDLLSHRTGLATLDEGLLAGYPQTLSRAELCKKLKYLPAKRPIRDGFIYNNYIYTLLGHMTEILGKDTWENLLTSRILVPLGMNSTRILKMPSDVLESDVAKPYIFKDGEFQNGTSDIYEIYPNEPAGAILSNAVDMAMWIKFNLELGKTEAGDQLLDRKLMEEMHWATAGFDNQNTLRDMFLTRPQYPVDFIQIGYGYAWFLSTYRGYKMVWHSGALFSYVTMLWFFPDLEIGMYASVNGPAFMRLPGRHLTTVFYFISDYLLGLEPWLNETTACTFPESWSNSSASESPEPEVPITVDNMDDYTGVYTNSLLPDIDVSINDANSTNMIIRFNRIQGIFHPSSEKDRFLFEITHPWEFAVEYTDNNNMSIYANITFLRNQQYDVYAFKAALEVEMMFVKDGMTFGASSGSGRSLSMANIVFAIMYSLHIV